MGGWVDVTRTGYIVVFHGSGGDRFVHVPAFKRWRGMYRNRRMVGMDRAEWTPLRLKAYAFPSRARAQQEIKRAGIPANSKTIEIEIVKRLARTWVD